MKKLVALMLLAMASTAYAVDSGRYVALKGDKTVAVMAERWTSEDGRVVKWEAKYDFQIRDAEALNEAAHLASASTPLDAVQRLGKLLAEAYPEVFPLAPCVYSEGSVYMVIRTLDESCGKRAN